MHFHKIKMELALPVFLGALSGLLVSAVLTASGMAFLSRGAAENRQFANGEAEAEGDSTLLAAQLLAGTEREKRDIIKELYREAETQARVKDFFTGLCGSGEIAEVILLHADAFNIAPSLAFALSWEESRFNPLAVNARNRNESIDRGLFQLNNRSFPNLDTQIFFNPAVNAYYGMSHLRHCLNTGGTEIAALAMYNAGTGRVGSTGKPKSTLDYIDRILENRRRIESQFRLNLLQETEFLASKKSQLMGRADALESQELDFVLNQFSEKLSQAKPPRSRFFPLGR